MKRYLFFVLTLAACGGGNRTPPQTAQSVHAECVDFCYREAACLKEVCNQDYPGSVSDFGASVAGNNCVHQDCDTTVFVDRIKTQHPEYLTCMTTKSCREIMSGACGDVAHCTSSPNSTPHPPPPQKGPR